MTVVRRLWKLYFFVKKKRFYERFMYSCTFVDLVKALTGGITLTDQPFS